MMGHSVPRLRPQGLRVYKTCQQWSCICGIVWGPEDLQRPCHSAWPQPLPQPLPSPNRGIHHACSHAPQYGMPPSIRLPRMVSGCRVAKT